RFGKHKLAPEISPGKTWEGVYGALAAVTLYGAILCYTQNFSFWLIVSLWMLVALSVIGDLIESLMKRKAGVKDSGTLLPGHGGVLDRI
ncbi:MAG: phosphatidate cytidylyltransferase, partial [Methylotenera sp.]